MANIKSQLKRIKTNRTRTERNKAVKSELRTWVRKFRVAAAAGDKDAASDALKVASKKLDKAVQNYEDTLRVNPDNMPAKYNLEMIQSEGGGNGGGNDGKSKNQPKI